MRRVLLPLALVGTFAAVANVQAASVKDSFDLKGEVYKSYKIEMKNSANRPLTTVRAGIHRIKVEDMTRIHDFHLVGPGVNKSSSVSGVGEQVWTVNLKPGRYSFFCDPHASNMRGTFRVTS